MCGKFLGRKDAKNRKGAKKIGLPLRLCAPWRLCVQNITHTGNGTTEMSLFAKLQKRAADGKPVRIGLIGAGKFGSMYLAQVPRLPGMHLVAIADLSPAAARRNLERVGWPVERASAGLRRSTLARRTRWRTATASGASLSAPQRVG